jgi:formylglycine-generating enzyme required for sulfatase activity
MEEIYYDRLGLEKGASIEAIKRAYWEYAKQLHPDKHQGEQFYVRLFQRVQEAHDYLSKKDADNNKILDAVIDSFTVSPTEISVGDTIEVSWHTSNTSKCEIKISGKTVSGSSSDTKKFKIKNGVDSVDITLLAYNKEGKNPKIKTVTVRLKNEIDFEMVFISGGTFTMGATEGKDVQADEKPLHQVRLSKYYIGKYAVTQAQWKAVMYTNPSEFKGDNLPVENVSWDEVQKFIQKLNRQTGKLYRLPTEAEWEFAARGGTKSEGYIYSGGRKADDVAWYDKNSGKKTHEKGKKFPNELGIYDMSGNVFEWCNDWYENYNKGSQSDPKGTLSGIGRVIRGGSWGSPAHYSRVSRRGNQPQSHKSPVLGFRLACSNYKNDNV